MIETKVMKTPYILVMLLGIMLLGCNGFDTSTLNEIQAYAQKEVPAQYFSINNKEGGVVEASSGTIIVVPEGAFLDSRGNTVKGEVDLAVTEALALADILLLGLTTESDGKLLESGGMLHLEATANGEPLSIDPDKPLYIEIPTANKKPGMMAYRCVEDSNGNVNWVDPKPLKQYLTTVEMDLLDLYPEGFEAAVQAGMPFREHQTATKELTDSLYYLMSVWRRGELTDDLSSTGNMVQPYFNANGKVQGGQYTEESYEESVE